jgi:phosphopantothenoylcysteine synthetase/decarboxylase
MNPSNHPTVVLGVTGSIAAYKAAEITRLLVKAGVNVMPVMTQSATRFLGPLTLQSLSQNPVATGLFDEEESWRPTHISLADSADLMLIAPVTANVMAKLAHGIADDVLTAIALATRAPMVLAPAMNVKMWEHPATRENERILKERGVTFIGPEAGFLACGYEGRGRMSEPASVVAAVLSRLGAGRGGDTA